MAGVANLPVDSTGAAKRTGADREGSKSPSTDMGDGTSSGAGKQSARRNASYGGSSGSVMQAMIGGPFMGRSGNSAKKSASVNSLPE